MLSLDAYWTFYCFLDIVYWRSVNKQRTQLHFHKLTCASVCMCVYVYTHTLSHVQLVATPRTVCSPRTVGSSVHGISQTRIREQVAIPFYRGSSLPRDQSHISRVCCIGSQVLYHQHHLESPDLYLEKRKCLVLQYLLFVHTML